MYVLRIEHDAANFDAWKAAFDADPVGRASKGVRRHQILRADDDRAFVSIELTFDTSEDAESLLTAMQDVWSRVTGSLISTPSIRLFHLAENQDY